MIPYLLALAGSYLIGESMQIKATFFAERFADGGQTNVDFDKYKSIFKKWLSSSLEVEFISKNASNDAPKEFIERRKKLYEKEAQNKKELDQLIKKLQNQGYDTAKMWRDMYNKDRLGDESTYKKSMEDGGQIETFAEGGLVGKRVRLIEMKEEPYPVPPGTMGTIVHIGGGVINVVWDNGRRLGLIEGVDEYEITMADGGNVSAKEYQIKRNDGKYYSLSMSTGKPAWNISADMGYQYTKEEAEKIKSMLEKDGADGLSVVKYDKDWWKNAPDEFAEGGATDTIAMTILKQLGGAGKLNAMTGAYNFRDLGNGLAFKIKNQRANYIKITLNGLDLYDLEVGRIRGTTYKVVASHNDVYFDQLKPLIEKATGMYLSLFAKGGKVIPITEAKVGDKVFDEKSNKVKIIKGIGFFEKSKFSDGYVSISFTDGTSSRLGYSGPHRDSLHHGTTIKKFAKGGDVKNDKFSKILYEQYPELKWQDVEIGDSARVKEINKTGVIMKTYGRKFHLKFVDGTEKTYDASELEFFKN